MSGCADVQVMLPEAALGLLPGEQRADVLAHVEGCVSCRELMHDLSAVTDDLVLLAPNGEPASGFEQAVLARLSPPRPRRRGPVVAGAVAAVLLAVVAFAAGRIMSDTPVPVREVAMRAPSGKVVGDAYVHGDDPSWVFVAVPGWTDASNEYRLRVTYVDGNTTEVPGSGSWGTILPGNPGRIRELALVGVDGRVWCTALVPV
ncbi:MAG: hypothetical protein QOD92_761 [Acidimicrobiaceae bacterium]|jgi:hypothetical protein